MKIIIAPQAFKDFASAKTIAETIARGISRFFPTAQVVLSPIADGGDGTLDVLVDALKGTKHFCRAVDALGTARDVEWGTVPTTPASAVIELAKICGLAQMQPSQRNPSITTTYGVGETIRNALDQGCRRIFVGLGGSATNDAGTGLLHALGMRFLNAHGEELPAGGAALKNLHSIDSSFLDPRLKESHLIAGCDVQNPLLGPNGASSIYSPQKGATQEMVKQLESALKNFAAIASRDLSINIADVPGSGAAGGAAAGMILINAQIVSGVQWILEELDFPTSLKDADLVIVGEGCLDLQTTFQKGPMAVARMAKKNNIPVFAIVGCIGKGWEKNLDIGIDAVFAASPTPLHSSSSEALSTIEKRASEAASLFVKDNLGF
jgi:glycerate kinase